MYLKLNFRLWIECGIEIIQENKFFLLYTKIYRFAAFDVWYLQTFSHNTNKHSRLKSIIAWKCSGKLNMLAIYRVIWIFFIRLLCWHTTLMIRLLVLIYVSKYIEDRTRMQTNWWRHSAMMTSWRSVLKDSKLYLIQTAVFIMLLSI